MSCTPTSLRLLTAALVTGLALTTAACSGDGASEADTSAYDDADVVSEMTDAMADQDSVRLTLGTKQTPDDITIDTTLGENRSFRAVTGGDPSQQLDVRLVDGRVYVGGELVGHQWTYLEVDDPRLTDPDSDFDAGIVTQLLDIDVVGDFATVESAVTDAEKVGSDEINGVDTDHYVLSVDTTEWFASLPEGSLFRQMTLPDSVEMDLYLDDESLPVQLAYEVPDKPEQSALVSFTEWGTPVEVTVPNRAKPVS